MRLLLIILLSALCLQGEAQSTASPADAPVDQFLGVKADDATSSNAAVVSLEAIFNAYDKTHKFAAELKSEQEAAQKHLAELLSQDQADEAKAYRQEISARLKSEYIDHRNEVIEDLKREIAAYASSHQVKIFDSDAGPAHGVPKMALADAKARNLPDVTADIIKALNANSPAPESPQ